MELLAQFIDIVLHLDKHLALMVLDYGLWIYGILFFIVFAETGFVVTPFLPGDSLLFVAGALAAIGEGGMDIFTLIGVLTAAAAIGNTVNYQIGRFLGREQQGLIAIRLTKLANQVRLYAVLGGGGVRHAT